MRTTFKKPCRPMSKDSSETCGNCAKHEPDPINPTGGLGDCPEHVTRLNLDGYVVAVLKYPGQRACNFFEKKVPRGTFKMCYNSRG